MATNRLFDPTMAALNIREEYHKDVEERLRCHGLRDDAQNKIITDIYAKDDIYFSLNRPYKHIYSSFADFCKEQELHAFLPKMLPSLAKKGRGLYTHQADAIRSILDEKITIISTGTGSGKTESFLIPILHHCLVQKNNGIKSVILYPLNALANDQIRRILAAVKGKGIRVGCFVGSTPLYKRRKPSDPEELCISRQEMIDKPPDILITNYVMLDRLITKTETRSMFIRSEHALKYIVVDEVHYFRGTKGANLSLLLRRFRTLCKEPLVQIGASGTLRQGGGYFPDKKKDLIEQFARLIFGDEAVTKNGFQLIEPAFVEFETETQLEPPSPIDSIEGNPLLDSLNKLEAERLCEQLFGTLRLHEYQQKLRGIGIKESPIYHLAMHSQFIERIHKRLLQGASTFGELVEEFCQIYKGTYHKVPRNPKSVVEAYWSLINYLNYRCKEAKIPLILDYRLHLILGDVGESLTRCLRCKRYHDGRCPRCRYCNNGLLFQVSKLYPDSCIAYLAGQELFPVVPFGRHKFDVLVQVSPEEVQSPDTTRLRFVLEPNLDAIADEESYLLRPALDGENGIVLRPLLNKQEKEAIPLSEAHTYWHNVLKVTDALVIQPETKTADKLLGFIDNKERASSIKLRLNDEIAERTLTAWSANKWSELGVMNLLEAFDMLRQEIYSYDDHSSSEAEENPANAPLGEMPFWFTRMLANIDEYKKEWNISVDRSLSLQDDEYELLNDIMLHENAIDRTSFWPNAASATSSLKHFHLEKYQVVTQYGVGLTTTVEREYNIISLGEQGNIYKAFIARMKEKGISIKKMLDDLTEREILAQKQTPSGTPFYQLHPST